MALLPVGFLGVVLIRCYQLSIARLLPPQCRFEPSCSRYGLQAFARYGALKGFLLTALRLGRCHPFCRAGHDPLPDGVDGASG
ncbi:MAG TPA: membrane protein insertion efficiency factor YidD [Planctomycetota bacterium]|nr:membrane protein insertion efficiency factor YidD [Planctomycetota bacterium]